MIKKNREFFDQFTYAKTKCRECHGVNHPFMIQRKLWTIVTCGDHKGFVCLFCIERILGRPLKDEDFMKVPINNGCFGFHYKMWTEGSRKDYQNQWNNSFKKKLNTGK